MELEMEKPSEKKPAFRSAAGFRKAREEYIRICNEKKRIPNPAGFCAYSGITRAAFEQLAEIYPLQYDLTRSVFLDEALNTKCANSGAVMQFLTQMSDSRSSGTEEGPFRLICEGGLEDGA